MRESDIRKRTSRRGRKKKSDTRFRCLADAPKIAEYKCKEDCLLVLYAIFNAIEQGGKTAELPTQEEMKEQREALKQYLESGKKLTEWTAELLKELLDM